ncbi:MAG: DUF4112 domain-containing protein [Hasllibacter sp.]
MTPRTEPAPGARPAPRHAPPPRAAQGGAPPHPRQAELDRIDRLADALDSRFSVLGFRFGWDSILGLVPGVGDVAGLLPSAYLVWEGRRMGASRGTLARMAANTGIDFVVGGVPVLGDVFDVAFKANRRNARLLREDIAGRG